jgi:hypothetical protein
MLGRAGSWQRTVSGGAGLTDVRLWFYQDFSAGQTSPITLTGNDNGTGGALWDSANIVNSSAVLTDTDGNPLYSNSAALPSQQVLVTSHIGTDVTYSPNPDSSFGTVRCWYLYQQPAGSAPVGLQIAPQFVIESRAEYMDGRFLNSALNLSDLVSASTARTNLGFSSQTAGRVLLGDGGSTFTSDSALFFDTSNDRLGIGTASPSTDLHVYKNTASAIITVESQFTSSPSISLLKSSRTSAANLALNDVSGRISFQSMAGSSYSDIAFIDGIYRGNGTTLAADFVISLSNLGAPSEVFRVKQDGTIDTLLGAGAVQSDSSGILSSGTLGIGSGGTGATSLSSGVVISNGSVLSTEAQLAVTRGGTALSAVGTANQLFGTNSGASGFEHKSATLTSAGTLTIPSGQVAIIPSGSVSAASLAISGSLGTGIYSPSADQLAITANGTQTILNTSSLVTITPAALFKTSIQLEDPGAGTNAITIQSPTLSGNYTLTLPNAQGAANTTIVNDGSGNLSWLRVPFFKAGTVSVSNGATTVAVSFGTDFGSESYSASVFFFNETDGIPLGVVIKGISKTSTGFTVELSEALDSGNYLMDWSILGHYNP